MNCTELQNLAAAHALGALTHAEEEQFQAALAASSDARRESAALADTAAAMAVAACSQLSPPPALRAKILAGVRDKNPTTSSHPRPPVPAGFKFILNDETGWQPGPLPGLRIKPLSQGLGMGYQMLLAELAPGARFPAHNHKGSEQLIVISGHLQTEGHTLGPGDFLHADPGTHHHELVSPDGCVALLIERESVPG